MAKGKKGGRNRWRSDEEQDDIRQEDRDWRNKDKKSAPIVVNAMTPGQKKYIVEINNNTITFCIGPAGSGKTAVAVGIALQHIMAPVPTYDKLIVMRPAKEACDEKIGHLPGGITDKMEPWAAPIMDNVKVFCNQSQIKNLLWNNKIEIIPTGFARGRSLNGAFIIVDESQNLSPAQFIMILTRIGKGSKMVFTGDLVQSDIRGKSGLTDAINRLQGIPGISFVEMTNSDIVRHPLIGEILKRYDDKK